MIDPPLTSADASTRTYGRDTGLYHAAKYTPTRCAYSVSGPSYYISSHQCSKKPGHGPDGLYCKQHAKRIQGDTNE